jgi:molybdopterin molybdotransferase
MNAPRKPLMPLDDALQQLLSHVQALTDTEILPTLQADGRVLAENLVSALQVPAFDNSSMDGYAVRWLDVQQAPVTLKVTQRIAAGQTGLPLQAGEAARIFTGAPVPPGADTVVMQEDTQTVDGVADEVRILRQPIQGEWVRLSGEDVRQGAVALPAGTRLSPAELGLAASLGVAQLKVKRKPRVALFSTGDELVMPGEVSAEQMRPGAIYNSNRFFLSALLHRMGCEVSDMGIVPDKREATLAALKSAADHHDLILTSGGVSVGEEDHVKPSVQALGALDLWQISMKPGKPFAYGHVRRSEGAHVAHFIGLPGNPVSSFMTFVLLVLPFLRQLTGQAQQALQPIRMPAHFSISKADRRREFVRVRRNAQGGLDLFPNQSSGVLTSVVWGDGVVDIPAGQTVLAGDLVDYLPFAGWLA